jgi:hypothetical protein
LTALGQELPFDSKKLNKETMNDQLVIREVIKDDFPEWKPLWDGYNAFYGRSGETALAP